MVDAADRRELFSSARRPVDDAGKREIRQYEPRWDVEGRSGSLSPRGDCLRDTARPTAQLARALDAPPRRFWPRPCPNFDAPPFALVERPRQPACFFESLDKAVVQREEGGHVGSGVHAPFIGKWSPRPVCEPVALPEPYGEHAVGQRGERWAAEADERRRNLGVEEAGGTPTAGPFEDCQILISRVRHHPGLACKQLSERMQIEGERVDESDPAVPRDLH